MKLSEYIKDLQQLLRNGGDHDLITDTSDVTTFDPRPFFPETWDADDSMGELNGTDLVEGQTYWMFT